MLTDRTSKRLIDMSVSIAGLIALAPLMAVVALAVRLQSPGPAIFRQPRVGRNGVVFTCYKFRSMHLGTPELPTHEAPGGSITPIGSLLRRSKLDELPQLLNVARGDMSLVGPRPCLPTQHELIEHRGTLGVLELRPGITGLAQVLGVDMSEPRRLARVDAGYGARQSLALDLRLVAATLAARRSIRRGVGAVASTGSTQSARRRRADAAGA